MKKRFLMVALALGLGMGAFSCLADENEPSSVFKTDNTGSISQGSFARSQTNAELGRIGDSSVGVWGATDSSLPVSQQGHGGDHGIQSELNSILSSIPGFSGISSISGGFYLRQDF